jgi:hypothetical protein
VRYDAGTYKVVTYGFGLEAVSGMAGTMPLGPLLDANLNWLGMPSGVENPTTPSLPLKFALGRAIPNPFNPTAALSYELRAASYVSLKVYDTAGRLVATLADGWRPAGEHRVTFDGSGLASGVYLYTLTAGGEHAAGKMVLLK